MLGLIAYFLSSLYHQCPHPWNGVPTPTESGHQSWIRGHGTDDRVHECMQLSMDKPGIHGSRAKGAKIRLKDKRGSERGVKIVVVGGRSCGQGRNPPRDWCGSTLSGWLTTKGLSLREDSCDDSE